MRRLAALTLITLGLCAATAQADQNVTTNPAIQTDLALAQTFWNIEQPDFKTPCAPEHVYVTTMTDGIGPNNTPIPAANVWAETTLEGCNINLSPDAWATAQTPNSQTDQWATCVLIAHEYGHTLGLPDSTSIPMMSLNWNHRDDPLCVQHVYGWALTPLGDREWLAEHHLDQRHNKGLA